MTRAVALVARPSSAAFATWLLLETRDARQLEGVLCPVLTLRPTAGELDWDAAAATPGAVVLESPHPMGPATTVGEPQIADIATARQLFVRFDERSQTNPQDYVEIATATATQSATTTGQSDEPRHEGAAVAAAHADGREDSSREDEPAALSADEPLRYSGRGGRSEWSEWPGCGGRPALRVESRRCVVAFSSSQKGSQDCWGYRLVAWSAETRQLESQLEQLLVAGRDADSPSRRLLTHLLDCDCELRKLAFSERTLLDLAIRPERARPASEFTRTTREQQPWSLSLSLFLSVERRAARTSVLNRLLFQNPSKSEAQARTRAPLCWRSARR